MIYLPWDEFLNLLLACIILVQTLFLQLLREIFFHNYWCRHLKAINQILDVSIFYNNNDLTVIVWRTTLGLSLLNLLVMDFKQSFGPELLSLTLSQISIIDAQSSPKFFSLVALSIKIFRYFNMFYSFVWIKNHKNLLTNYVNLPTCWSNGDDVAKIPILIKWKQRTTKKLQKTLRNWITMKQ